MKTGTALQPKVKNHSTPPPVSTRFDGYDHASLRCPNCDGPWMHHENVVVFSRRKEDDPTVVTRVDGSGLASIEREQAEGSLRNPSPRRDGIVIQFWCEECGIDDAIELVIEQHKGRTFLYWRQGAGLLANGRRRPPW